MSHNFSIKLLFQVRNYVKENMKSKVITSSAFLLASASKNDALTTKLDSNSVPTTTIATTDNSKTIPSSRRAFVASTILTSTTATGILLPQQPQTKKHKTDCECITCDDFKTKNLFLPKPANAYYERDVGDEGRSSATAAFNIQARETNSRLEASGFQLDTKEEEMKRLNDALSSSAYDSFASSGSNKKKNVGKGYNNDRSSSSNNDNAKIRK